MQHSCSKARKTFPGTVRFYEIGRDTPGALLKNDVTKETRREHENAVERPQRDRCALLGQLGVVNELLEARDRGGRHKRRTEFGRNASGEKRDRAERPTDCS